MIIIDSCNYLLNLTCKCAHYYKMKGIMTLTPPPVIDALVASMDVLARAKDGRKKVGALKVFLFTDAASGYSDDGLGQICRGLKEMGIQLLVM